MKMDSDDFIRWIKWMLVGFLLLSLIILLFAFVYFDPLKARTCVDLDSFALTTDESDWLPPDNLQERQHGND